MMHRSIEAMDHGTTNISHGALKDGHQFLETVTMLPRAIDEAFAFFANAENLERITPPELAFRILTPTPVIIREGTIIDYRLRLFGVPFHWRTRIVEWQPQQHFIDEQILGPYTSWRHRHTFAECETGTEMTDRVEYAVPGGALVQRWLVGRDVERIFAFRRAALKDVSDEQGS